MLKLSGNRDRFAVILADCVGVFCGSASILALKGFPPLVVVVSSAPKTWQLVQSAALLKVQIGLR